MSCTPGNFCTIWHVGSALGSLAVHGKHRALAPSGTNSETHQRGVQIAFVRGAPSLTCQVEAALVVLLPFIKRCNPAGPRDARSESKAKYLPILARTERAIYYLAIDEDAGLYELCEDNWGSHRTKFRAETLGALLAYAEQNYYLEVA
jgi:hypothetical protein